MRIHHPKTGEVIVNDFCLGTCYCHSLPIQFGTNRDICEECYCPKTERGFEEWKRRHPQTEEVAK